MSFNFCLLFNSVTHTVFSGNQICEILHHLLEHFGLPPSQIICFDREQKTFLQFSFRFLYLIQKLSPCQKRLENRAIPYTAVCLLPWRNYFCRFSLQMDWAWWFQHRTDPCDQVWSLHAEHIATGITPNNYFLSDLKACLPGIILGGWFSLWCCKLVNICLMWGVGASTLSAMAVDTTLSSTLYWLWCHFSQTSAEKTPLVLHSSVGMAVPSHAASKTQ